jgi:transposase
MGKSPVRPSERERRCGCRGDNRQHNDESTPARGRQSKGASRAGIAAKFHAAVPGDGRLVEGFLGGGQAAEVTVAARLTEDIVGCTVIADRGYDSDAFRRELRGNNNIPVIPGRKNRNKEIVYDKRIYRKRGLIERIFGKLKENRRLALRYEKSNMHNIAHCFSNIK